MNITPIIFRDMPRATKGLITACIAAYVAGFFFGPLMNQVLGLVPYRVTHSFWLWQLFTYLFLHGGFLHLLFNVLMLWIFGRLLEARWGPGRFLRYFFITGLGAAALSVVLSPSSGIPVIGASGAVYGLLAAFAVLYPDATVYLYFLFPVTARQMALILGAMEFAAGFSHNGGAVANTAHLGGLLTGWLYLKRGNIGGSVADLLSGSLRRMRTPRSGRDSSGEAEAEIDRILEKISAGGRESLTVKELDIMRRYSQRLKR
ncbi:MAG: rhomboid family intramembrane serine protease [bacterium]